MMTNESANTIENKPTPFGLRLKEAREALGFERKDVAAQLRLNEKIITMMEKDRYPADLPVTFIRGYMRAYAKLLQIPEYEVKKAIEPIKPKYIPLKPTPSLKELPIVTSSNYFMQFFTALIVITMLGLVGLWWYSNATPSAAPIIAENSSIIAPLATPAASEATVPAATTAEHPNPPTPAVQSVEKPKASKPIYLQKQAANETDEEMSDALASHN